MASEYQNKATEYQNSTYRSALFRGLLNTARLALSGHPTVLGRRVVQVPLTGLYILEEAKNQGLSGPEYTFAPSELDVKIGVGNTRGRIFKRSDGTWRYADGTIVNFKSPTSSTTGTTTVQTNKSAKPLITNRGTTGNRRSARVPQTNIPQTNTPQSNFTKDGLTYTGFTLDTKAQIPNYVKPLATLQQPQISLEDWNTYINQPIVDNNTNTTNYDTNYIRGFRGQGELGYRDVDSYLTWLKNNKDSADYKLFMQNGYFKDSGDALDGNELDYDLIGAMLASQGIRGNLGRRDSRRLGNVLTRLRDLSTAGTNANKEFLQGVVSSYNLNKDKWVRPAEGYTGLRNATITGDGLIGFLDESGNETFFPYSKLSPTYLINGSSPEFLAIRNLSFATNPGGGFLPVSLGNWLGSAGNILGSTYRPQWNITTSSGNPYPRTAFFGTSISNLADNIMKAWNDFTRGLLPHRGFNSGANS